MQYIIPEYKLINTEPTHLSGSLLDHLYLGKHIFQKRYLEAMQIGSLQFSGNQAVQFKLRFYEM